ncbi:MAG: D-inositol 3-phosphate glycosyltransferase [Bacteroidetes bacterium ADurb.Bin408]|nr:MAG: D-inositol 3-phosphate glycosyltransferase [Bacteroidetes bacterium ADurb.Bin408]
MHDMNPFTGGCHYSMACANYEQDCATCPQLEGTINPLYAAEILKIKNISGISKSLHIVTPSQWLSECSKRSAVMRNFPHHVIPNGFPAKVFVRRDKVFSRNVFGLPVDKKIALFVAGDIHCRPKGYYLLKEALGKTGLPEDLILCAVGEKHLDIKTGNNIIELGPITDERLLNLVYSAADVYITPSMADNLPNTVVESLLCGTPVIAFNIGGLANMLTHGVNGMFCSEISTESLAKTISEFFLTQHAFVNENISKAAHAVYDIEIVARQYIHLYKQILKQDD